MWRIRNLLRKYQDVVIPVVFLLAAAAGVIFGIVPAGQRLVGLLGEINQTAQSVALLRQKKAFLDSLNETDLQDKLVIVVSALPTGKLLPGVFQVVDQLSAQTGVTVTDMSLVAPGSLATEAAQKQTTEEKALGSSLVPFTVTLAGPLDGLAAFLSKITTVRRLVRVRNFDVSLPKGSAAMLRVSLDAFYAPLPKLSAQTEQKLPTLTTEENATLAKLSAYPWLTQPVGVQSVVSGGGKQNPFVH